MGVQRKSRMANQAHQSPLAVLQSLDPELIQEMPQGDIMDAVLGPGGAKFAEFLDAIRVSDSSLTELPGGEGDRFGDWEVRASLQPPLWSHIVPFACAGLPGGEVAGEAPIQAYQGAVECPDCRCATVSRRRASS